MKVVNRRALHDYEVLDSYETGIVLTGPEVKSVRSGRISLEGSFVKIIGVRARFLCKPSNTSPIILPQSAGKVVLSCIKKRCWKTS